MVISYWLLVIRKEVCRFPNNQQLVTFFLLSKLEIPFFNFH